ncbi:luxQ, partial [Symbiodinium microadriaticum]
THYERVQMKLVGSQALKASRLGGPRPQRLPDGTWVTAKYWGIRQKQIEELYKSSRLESGWSDDADVHHFVETVVKPATAGTEMGYALMLNQHAPQQVTLMISHAWVENAREFFEDVLASTWDTEVAFICFLSNFQGTPEQIDAQLGNDILKSPFTEVIRSPACQRMLVVPNEALRQNGRGLYSRLWCIWEIKVAADAGLPIQIVDRKSEEEYLLGNSTVSSKNARCGDPDLPMNKDEQLIRSAIHKLPPHSSRSAAAGCFAVCCCCSYGSCIGVNLTKSYLGLLCGSLVGLLASTLAVTFIVQRLRKCAWNLQDLSGYHILDRVIRDSARGAYSWRRITAHGDVPLMVVTTCFWAGFAAALRYSVLGQKADLPKAGVEGMGFALLLFFCIKVNLLGTVHGEFFVTRWAQWSASLVMVLFTVVGSLLAACVSYGCDGMFGLGANIGFLTGVLLLGICTKHFVHAAATLLVIAGMLTSGWLSPILWRECFLILAGSINMLMTPEWRWFQRLLVALLCLVSLAGLEILHMLFNSKGLQGLNGFFCQFNRPQR